MRNSSFGSLRIRALLLPLVAGLASAACLGSPVRPPQLAAVSAQAGNGAAAPEYRIGVNDVLRISVWRQPELTLDSVVVRPDGRISVPLLDDVDVSGKTPAELKGEITQRLGEFVREPAVTVVVLESRSRLVYVQGEVARKGLVPLTPGMRVSDALALSGGLGPFADAGEILVLRENGAGYGEFKFDYNDFVEGKDLTQNILLEPGDRIVVQEKSLF
jgi:polysaccharide biosynthesis/export protein